jgi:hypothetical protein
VAILDQWGSDSHQVITIRNHDASCDVFLLPVTAPLSGGLADLSTSNTGQQAKLRPTSCRKLKYRSRTATVDDQV